MKSEKKQKKQWVVYESIRYEPGGLTPRNDIWIDSQVLNEDP